MSSSGRPEGPSHPAAGDALPRPPRELRLELLRRLALLEREVRALANPDGDPRLQEALEILRAMERELRARLAREPDTAGWLQSRAEIVALWRRHRQAFERLAGESRRKHPARPGRRDRGPRW